MNSQYVFLPRFYDRLNTEVDYNRWAADIKNTLDKNGVPETGIVLDLACGTGSISIELAKAGYDVIGIDISPEMLDCAREKAYGQNIPSILWLCQDMREFELYGTVSAIVCCLDSLNYILKQDELKHIFSLIWNYLDYNGILIFDVNTPYRFREILAKSDFIFEDDGVYCGWQNYYDEKNGICDFDLSIFSMNAKGTYTRADEHQRERCWSLKTLKNAITSAGLEILSITDTLCGSSLSENAERWHFICKKPDVNKV